MTRRTRIGAVLWAVQPLVVVIELMVAISAASAAVPLVTVLRDRSISELGANWNDWVVLGGPEPVQSPAWWLMDAAFVASGVAMAVGAVLLRPSLPAGLPGTAITTLWVLVGLSSAAAGVIPLHVDVPSHVVLSAPALILQAPALLLLGRVLPAPWRTVTLTIGVVSLVGAVGYLSRPATAIGSGVFERLTLWPASLWLPVAALVLVARRRRDAAAT